MKKFILLISGALLLVGCCGRCGCGGCNCGCGYCIYGKNVKINTYKRS